MEYYFNFGHGINVNNNEFYQQWIVINNDMFLTIYRMVLIVYGLLLIVYGILSIWIVGNNT